MSATVRITGWADPLGECIPMYRVRYGEKFWEDTPATEDRQQAEEWAAWVDDGQKDWAQRPWRALEEELTALRREWANDYDEAYVAADGNRYSSVIEHDLVWKGDE